MQLCSGLKGWAQGTHFDYCACCTTVPGHRPFAALRPILSCQPSQVKSTSAAVDFAEDLLWKKNGELKTCLLRMSAQLSLHLDPNVRDRFTSSIDKTIKKMDKKKWTQNGCMELATELKALEDRYTKDGKIAERDSLNAENNCIHFMVRHTPQCSTLSDHQAHAHNECFVVCRRLQHLPSGCNT